ncbi:MAG: CT583 family protein [Chlamydiae bacterium]|nr:CT583 family protein [Chlamydiota bacterium]
MPNFHALLNLRLRSKESQKPKMTALAEKSSSGELSSFSGVFKVSSLNEDEKQNLADILKNFEPQENTALDNNDLQSLITITAEVKAITNQAVMLHGERIKRAQDLLKKYKDGAFTAWLLTIYGNRQTPYNFLQYYEFYTSMAPELQARIDIMPRQAIYTLASRTGSKEQKEEVVKTYQGQSKKELLLAIRKMFPLALDDKRQSSQTVQIIDLLKKIRNEAKVNNFNFDDAQKSEITELLEQIRKFVYNKD